MLFINRIHFFLFINLIAVVNVIAQPGLSDLDKTFGSLDFKRQIKYCDSLAMKWRHEDPSLALSYINKGIEIAVKSNNEYFEACAINSRAKIYKQLSDYELAENDLNKALYIFKKLNDKSWMTSVFTDLGSLYYMRGKYDTAIGFYLKGLKMAEEVKDLEMQAKCFNNIGNIYFLSSDFDKAITYYQKAYDMNKALGDIKSSALTLDNIGLVYINKGELDMALLYQTSALKVMEKLGDKQLLAETLMNLGALHIDMGKYEGALKYFDRAFILNSEMNSKYGMAACLTNKGNALRALKKYDEALSILNESMLLSKEIGAKQSTKQSLEYISKVYEDMRKPDEALKYYKLYSNIKDTIYNNESSDKINELSARYETDKKQKAIELLTKDKDLQQVKLRNQRILNISLISGISLVLLLLILSFRRYREKQKANIQLEEKNLAILHQKELLAHKNKEITDSINYAKRIQEAMLPSEKILKECFPESFIFYKPKDIISGDFYWATKHNGSVYIAAADCTGHGVPGALMSMIGISFLRQIINESNINDTAEILNKLHIMVISALNESLDERVSKDGMDISLLKLDPVKKDLQFSGAVRPLYYIENGELLSVKGDRFSIGGVKAIDESFSSHHLPLNGNKFYYMFSDGIADQFGGPAEKKFMVGNLQRLLIQVSSQEPQSQKKDIEDAFNEWKGAIEQTDDVMVVGFKA
jgi:tetratricopeptide (TPR) repeat protein